MNYVEVSLRVEPYVPYADILVSDLAEIGFDSFIDEAPNLLAYSTVGIFKEAELKEIIQSRIAPECKIQINHIKEIEQQNWNAEWEASFSPVKIDSKLIIRASFHPFEPGFEQEIIINPKMSFGTGHHATTYLISKAMFDIDLHGKSVLDAGCGTSILGILASKLGAQRIYGYDIDEWSVENSIENLDLNTISNMTVEKGDAHLLKGKQFDVILANINKNVLLNDVPQFSECLVKNGLLYLSGFFKTDVQDLVDFAMNHNLAKDEVYFKEGWACIKLKKIV